MKGNVKQVTRQIRHNMKKNNIKDKNNVKDIKNINNVRQE